MELNKPISSSEIDLAIQNMTPWKAPRPDGFLAGFYQHNWDLFKQDIYSLIQNWYDCPTNIQQFNQTILTLIPKIKNPSTLDDWKPISLCNTTY